jgi:hypothetical protein
MTMPNYGYHLARARGRFARSLYSALLPVVTRQQVRVSRTFPLEVYSYSGEAALPEQVASIRSFLNFVGRPPRFTVVSDGTYSAKSIRLLQRLDRSVVVEPSSAWIPRGHSRLIDHYLREHPTGRQLALIMSLPKNGPALYTDSDVLFFRGGDDLFDVAADREAPAVYLRDCQLSGDSRLLRGSDPKMPAVNTGFLLLFRELDWSLGIERFLELDGAPNFFTNQTMAHLTMHSNGATPLDPATYVLQLDDQFVYLDRYASNDIAIRHYVNPVRHKFWTAQ